MIRAHQKGEMDTYTGWNMSLKQKMPIVAPNDALDKEPQRCVVKMPKMIATRIVDNLGIEIGEEQVESETETETVIEYIPPGAKVWDDAVYMLTNTAALNYWAL